MTKLSEWSLPGEPPEPQYMPTPTPEQAAAVRAELAKLGPAPEEDRRAAIARGMAAGAATQEGSSR